MNNTETLSNRRRFTRIPFEAAVTLSNPKGKWNGKLLDISLKGILISRPQNWYIKEGENFLLDIHPSNQAFSIRMEAEVSHSHEETVGFQCLHIDIDSVSHLKRLVELNLGNEELLYRELSVMIAA